MITDLLIVSLIILTLIIAYKLLLKRLSKGRVDANEYCVLYSTETFAVKGEVEFYFQCPRPLEVDFKIWGLNEKELFLVSKQYDKGGHIIRYDTSKLENGVYTFGIETESQKTVKKFKIDN